MLKFLLHETIPTVTLHSPIYETGRHKSNHVAHIHKILLSMLQKWGEGIGFTTSKEDNIGFSK